MVFTGKPSTGCGTCKKRRVKCDEQRPKCGQCIKSKRECTGYVNRLDLLFRDETVATVSRANNALSRATSKKPSGWTSDLTVNTVPSSSTSNSTPNTPAESWRKARITHSPTIGVREQASNHFLSNYVLIPPGSIGFSYYGYIVPLIKTSTRPHFLAAYEACSLASLANCLGSGVELEKQALGKYTKALSLVSSAISDPVLSLENDTIVSIQLLGLYENIAGKHFGSLAWGSHIEGVIHLCRQRGPEMMQTEAGRQILRHVKTQCMIYLYTNMKGFSKGVEVWLQDLEIDAITSRFHSIGLQVGLLRHDMIRQFGTSPRDPQNAKRMIAMIEKCKTLDRMCVEWTRNLPERYRHRTMQWDFAVINNDYSNIEAFPGKINIFPGTWSSALWCILQGTRIVTCSLILRRTAWQHMSPSYLDDPTYKLYFEALREVVNEMAASTPYLMGWLVNHPEQQTAPNLDTYVCGMDNVVKGLGSYNAIWSLSCVMCSDTTSDEQRAWAQGRLRYISDVLGIRSARGTLALTNKFPSGFIRYDAMVMQKLGVYKSAS